MSTPRIGPFCSITPDVELANDVVVQGWANLYGCKIGEGSRIGPFVEIQSDVVIGRRVRVQSHTFVCSLVTVEDDVFVGHNVNFINDRYPTSVKAERKTWQPEPILVRRGASIGTGAIILCGVEIGEGAVVGAGSVVVDDVPPHTVAAGIPARMIRELSMEQRWWGGGTAPLQE